MDDMEVHSQSPPASVANSFLIHLSLAPSLSQEVLMVIIMLMMVTGMTPLTYLCRPPGFSHHEPIILPVHQLVILRRFQLGTSTQVEKFLEESHLTELGLVLGRVLLHN